MTDQSVSIGSPSRRKAVLSVAIGTQAMVLLNIVRNVFFMPLYLYYVQEAVLGSWIALTSALGLIGLADLGINSLLTQRTAALAGGRQSRQLAHTIASGMVALAVLAGIALTITLMVAPLAAGRLGLEGENARQLTLAFRLACVDGSVTLVLMGIGAVLLGLQRPTVYITAVVVGQIVTLTVILLLLRSGVGIVALPLGMLAGTVTALVGSGLDLRGHLRRTLPLSSFSYDVHVLKELLGSSSLLLTSRICKLVSNQSSGVVVALVMGPSFVIVLEVTRKASLLVVDILTKLTASVFPGLAHLVGADESEKFQETTLVLLRFVLLAVLTGAGGVFIFNREFVRLWVGSAYYGGDLLTGMLCCFAGAQIVSALANTIVFSRGLIKPTVWAAFAEAVLQLGLSVLFGMKWGLPGIVGASIIASAVGLCIMGSFGITAFPSVSFAWNTIVRVGSLCFLGAVPVLLGTLAVGLSLPQGWWQLGGFVIAYALVCLMMLIVDSDIRHVVVTLPSAWRH